MRNEKDKMLAGELYDASDEVLSRERMRAKDLLFEINHTRPAEAKKIQSLFQELIKCKGNFHIEPHFYCDYGYNITVGDNFYANHGCVILDVCSVTIGDNVLLAPYVQIYSATHPTNPVERLTGKEFAKPVSIGNNVWIGGGAIVCPGVRIGGHVTIGAGSVVTNDIPDDVVAVGNPARIIKKVREE